MHINTQLPEKAQSRDYTGAFLELHSQFGPTIQGEGPFAGQPCFFIRLAGCNLQCPGCDTDYTVGRQTVKLGEILSTLAQQRRVHPNVNLVIITGGEPFRQQIGPLVEGIHAFGMRVQIETNGTLAPRPIPFKTTNELGHEVATDRNFPWDKCTVVCSPKAGGVAPGLHPHIAAYKYVVRDGEIQVNDGLPTRALMHPCSPKVSRPHEGFTGPVYVQPMDEGEPVANARNQAAALRSCFIHGWTYCAQLHKYLDLA